MRVGPLEIGSIDQWKPVDGFVTTWQPTARSLEKAAAAPVSSVPVGFMQAQHIRGICEQRGKGLDYSRLMVVSCEFPGQCDERAMSYVINAHLRRQDTYRSWFEYREGGQIVRRTMDNPADIEFRPVRDGELTLDEIRDLVVSTPDPLQWDCFRFGVIQGQDKFTLWASIDHVHLDATIVTVTLLEFYMTYNALVAGGGPLSLPEAGSYAQFCEQRYEYAMSLDGQSPEIQAWKAFMAGNQNSYPDFPLSLGDASVPSASEMVTMSIMDNEQMARFESACVDAGARFIGGVFACFAQTEHELTGAQTYYGLTPRDTRRKASDAMTLGWFTGLSPVTVPVAGLSFAEAARAAQQSFDEGKKLASVPLDRVLELEPSLSGPRPNFPVINFLDAGTAPLSALLTADLGSMNVGVYGDGRYSYQLSIWVARVAEETAVTVMFPDNPEARASVERYLSVLKAAFESVAERGQWRKAA